MSRFSAFLALSIALSACATVQKASPAVPAPAPVPKAQPSPNPAEPPKAPEAPDIEFNLQVNLASVAWAPVPLTEQHRAMGIALRLENGMTGARYTVEAVPLPEATGLEGFVANELKTASDSGVETSEPVFAPDGLSASFYYEAYGSDARGKAFLFRKPGEPMAVVARAVWPLTAQEASVADIDKMNATLDYTVKK